MATSRSTDRTHRYDVTVTWTGNRGRGTADHRSYERAHEVWAKGRPVIAGSSDPAFRGDPARWNPEQLLVAALSQCHMLWFLHLASAAGVVIVDYRDEAVGWMAEEPDGSGRFTEVVLAPAVVVADTTMVEAARELHDRVDAMCFIARSVNFPVRHRTATFAASSGPTAVTVTRGAGD